MNKEYYCMLHNCYLKKLKKDKCYSKGGKCKHLVNFSRHLPSIILKLQQLGLSK